MKKTIYIDGMMCSHCQAFVQKTLAALPGVESAEVSLEEKKAVLTLSGEVSDKVLMDAVAEAGYTPLRCE